VSGAPQESETGTPPSHNADREHDHGHDQEPGAVKSGAQAHEATASTGKDKHWEFVPGSDDEYPGPSGSQSLSTPSTSKHSHDNGAPGEEITKQQRPGDQDWLMEAILTKMDQLQTESGCEVAFDDLWKVLELGTSDAQNNAAVKALCDAGKVLDEGTDGERIITLVGPASTVAGTHGAAEVPEGPPLVAAAEDERAELEPALYQKAESALRAAGLAITIMEVLDAYYRGRSGATGQQRTVSQGPDPQVHETFTLSRADWYSLEDGQELQDGIVQAMLASQFPRGVSPDGKTYVDRRDINGGMTMRARRMDAGDVAINESNVAQNLSQLMTPEFERLAAVINEDAFHWYMILVEKATARIYIVDSWALHQSGEEAARRRKVEAKLKKLLDNVFGISSVEEWRDCVGHWTCEWPLAFRQRNNVDCGVHAVQNMIDLVRANIILPYHDANMIRRRFATRLQAALALDGKGCWGSELSRAEEIRREWAGLSSNAPAGPPAFSMDFGIRDAIHKRAAGTAVFDPKYANLTAKCPLFPKIIRMKQAAAYIMDQNPEGATYKEIEAKYHSYCNQHRFPLPNSWKIALSNIFTKLPKRSENAWFKGNTSGGLLTLTEYGRTTHLSSTGIGFFDKTMDQYVERAKDTRDDIHVSPDLIVLISRDSNTRASTEKDQWSDLHDYCMRMFALWCRTFGRALSDAPTEIKSAEDVSDDHGWQLYCHKIIRSSYTKIFEDDDGHETREDRRFKDVLRARDDLSKQSGKKAVVLCLWESVDGWTTDFEGLMSKLTIPHPDSSIRLTMVMPPDRVLPNFSTAFTERPHPGATATGEACAWAHFDMSVVVDIHKKVLANKDAPIQLQRYDQYALRYILAEVASWKFASQLNGPTDGEHMSHVRSLHPVGGLLVDSLLRHTVPHPQFDQKCLDCGEAPQVLYHRPNAEPTSAVMCQPCWDNRKDSEDFAAWAKARTPISTCAAVHALSETHNRRPMPRTMFHGAVEHSEDWEPTAEIIEELRQKRRDGTTAYELCAEYCVLWMRLLEIFKEHDIRGPVYNNGKRYTINMFFTEAEKEMWIRWHELGLKARHIAYEIGHKINVATRLSNKWVGAKQEPVALPANFHLNDARREQWRVWLKEGLNLTDIGGMIDCSEPRTRQIGEHNAILAPKPPPASKSAPAPKRSSKIQSKKRKNTRAGGPKTRAKRRKVVETEDDDEDEDEDEVEVDMGQNEGEGEDEDEDEADDDADAHPAEDEDDGLFVMKPRRCRRPADLILKK